MKVRSREHLVDGGKIVVSLDGIESRLSFRWNGAHTVNVFVGGPGRWPEWREVDVYSIGDFGHDSATWEGFESSVAYYLGENKL